VHYLTGNSGEVRTLLDSRDFARFVDAARPYYDLIILDAAPVLAGDDVMRVARLADLRVFVARLGRTRRDRMQSALSVLHLCGSNADGLVLTDIERSKLYRVLSACFDAPVRLRRRRDGTRLPGTEATVHQPVRYPVVETMLYQPARGPREAAGD
jgi:hypothetical protein